MLAVYVHDTRSAGNPDFMKLTDKISKKFESKRRKFPSFPFAGVKITKDELEYFL